MQLDLEIISFSCYYYPKDRKVKEVKAYKKYEITTKFTERIPEGEEPSRLDEEEEESEGHMPIVDIVRQDAKNMSDVYRRLRRGS